MKIFENFSFSLQVTSQYKLVVAYQGYQSAISLFFSTLSFYQMFHVLIASSEISAF